MVTTPSDQALSHVPRWDKSPEHLEDFEERVKLWILGTKKDDRCLLGPRLLSVMPVGSLQ